MHPCNVLNVTLQAWFIVPVAVFFISVSAFLIFAPLLDTPLSPLIALGFLALGVPVYFFLVMQTPWKIRPKIIDRISGIEYKLALGGREGGRNL